MPEPAVFSLHACRGLSSGNAFSVDLLRLEGFFTDRDATLSRRSISPRQEIDRINRALLEVDSVIDSIGFLPAIRMPVIGAGCVDTFLLYARSIASILCPKTQESCRTRGSE